MRFRLRYQERDIDLTEGSFLVGRSSSCQLFLDDPLVSRRHALLVVDDRGVRLEDLQSRNGVSVNDQRISTPTSLQPGDRIQVGSQEILLTVAPHDVVAAVSASASKMTLSRMPTLAGASSAPRTTPASAAPRAAAPGSSAPHVSPTSSAPQAVPTPSSPQPPPPPSSPETDPSTARRLDALALLSGVAEKALAMGRTEEAERLLSGPFRELVAASRDGKPLPASLVDVAATFAARLAAATGKGMWADLVIELYQAQDRPFPAAVADELNVAVRRASAIDGARLRAYLDQMRAKQAGFGPAERFLLQRIEGLSRLVLLR